MLQRVALSDVSVPSSETNASIGKVRNTSRYSARMGRMRNAVLEDDYSSHIHADELTGAPSGRVDEALQLIDAMLAARGSDVGQD